MKIGDRIKFDCYLPYNNAGWMNWRYVNKHMNGNTDGIEDNVNEDGSTTRTYTRYVIPCDKIKDGIFVGLVKRKLIRQYNYTSAIPPRDRNVIVDDEVVRLLRGEDHADIEEEIETINATNIHPFTLSQTNIINTANNIFSNSSNRTHTVTTLRDNRGRERRRFRRISSSRMDNVNSLSDVAIISTSKFKRYYVPYKYLVKINLRDNIEII